MRFNLISNLANGVGLQKDYELLRRQLEIRGHTVKGVQFNAKPLQAYLADVNIFLEVVNPMLFRAAPKQWAVPNPEWWFRQWDQYPWDLILAKTRDSERIFRAKVGEKCQYIGWLARDLYNSNVPRQKKFLHVAGKSKFKNTLAVIAGCQHAQVSLTIIGEHFGIHRRVSESELKTLMNSHFCHVMPSAYEGYGHVLHEALGVGQMIITTNAPPMNEIAPAVLIPSIDRSDYHAGTLHKVSPLDVSRAVRKVLAYPQETLQQYSKEARARFQQNNQAFYTALDALVGEGNAEHRIQ